MNLVFIGTEAIKLVPYFEKYKVYKIFKVSDEPKAGGKFLKVPKCVEVPSYEDELPAEKIETFFKTLKGNSLFFVCGGETASLLSLKILEELSKKGTASVFYLKPDVLFLNREKKEVETMVFKTLQYYTMNGLLGHMYVVDMLRMIGMFGSKNLESLASLVYSIDYYDNQKPSFDNYTENTLRHSIRTLGVGNIEKQDCAAFFEEKRLYGLLGGIEKKYYYVLTDDISKSEEFLSTLRERVKKDLLSDRKVCYGVYTSRDEGSFVISIESSVEIQE